MGKGIEDSAGSAFLPKIRESPTQSWSQLRRKYADLGYCAIGHFIDQHKDVAYPTARALAAEIAQRSSIKMYTKDNELVNRDEDQILALIGNLVWKRNKVKENPGKVSSSDLLHDGSSFMVPFLYTQAEYDSNIARPELLLPDTDDEESSSLTSASPSLVSDDDGEYIAANAAKSPTQDQSITTETPAFAQLSSEVVVPARTHSSRSSMPESDRHTVSDRTELVSHPDSVSHTSNESAVVRDKGKRARQGSGEPEQSHGHRASKLPRWAHSRAQLEVSAGSIERNNASQEIATNTTSARGTNALFLLSESDLRSRMVNMCGSITSLVIDELLDMGIEHSIKAACFSSSTPSGGSLDKLQRLLLGPGMASERRVLIADTMSVAHFIRALIGAFFLIEVFGASSVLTADEFVEQNTGALGSVASSYEQVCSMQMRTPFVTTDTLLRRAYRAWAGGPEIETDKDLLRLADSLALQLADTLLTHLNEYCVQGGPAISRLTRFRWASRLESVIMHGLVLKCLLSSAPEVYHFQWHNLSDGQDERTMENTHRHGNTVVATVFPGLQVEVGGETRVVYKMQVRLKSLE